MPYGDRVVGEPDLPGIISAIEDDLTIIKAKLAGIQAGATVNSPDTELLSRLNHTGTQLASTISDLSAAVDARISTGTIANLRSIEWTGNLATTRPSNSTAIRYMWIKRSTTIADPPTDDTHMLAGVDILLRATGA